jgi:hypothetical protein
LGVSRGAASTTAGSVSEERVIIAAVILVLTVGIGIAIALWDVPEEK